MRSILLVMLSICISGCATFSQMERGLNTLTGQSTQTAFDVLGYPSGKQEFGRETVYYWSLNTSGALLLPTTATTTGTIGYTPVNATTTYNQIVPVNYSCFIKLVADEAGTIRTWEYNGNYGGCYTYIKRLNQFSKNWGYEPKISKRQQVDQAEIIAKACKSGTISSEDPVCK